MQDSLISKKCVACDGNMPPLTKDAAEILLQQTKDWSISPDTKSIHKEIRTKNFKASLALANAIGDLAESEGHHPDLLVSWGKLSVTLTTHAMKGLSENDFIMAAKIDQVLDQI